ncbi:MAG: hypothetical protein U0N62_08015, partial [Hydrogeniiclostridium sp.]
MAPTIAVTILKAPDSFQIMSAAACLCLAAGLWLRFLPRMGSSAGAGGAAGEEGAVFQSYAGPVLPLTLSEETETVTAERTVTWDFAPWE